MTKGALQRDLTVVFLLAVGALEAGGDRVALIATQGVMTVALIAWWVATGRRH